jgi:aspartate carbamoyltransferase catalytic subunit
LQLLLLEGDLRRACHDHTSSVQADHHQTQHALSHFHKLLHFCAHNLRKATGTMLLIHPLPILPLKITDDSAKTQRQQNVLKQTKRKQIAQAGR